MYKGVTAIALAHWQGAIKASSVLGVEENAKGGVRE